MSNSEDDHSVDEAEMTDFLENSSHSVDSRNPFKVLREQLILKEKAVMDQQIALDVKDSNLKDAEISLKQYDDQINVLEAKIK